MLSQAIDRPINSQEISIAEARQQSKDAALVLEWFDRVGADADIAASRRDFSEVSWLSLQTGISDQHRLHRLRWSPRTRG